MKLRISLHRDFTRCWLYQVYIKGDQEQLVATAGSVYRYYSGRE